MRRLGPFRHLPFAAYWLGGMVSNAGTWLQSVAGSVYVYDRTGSALAVGVLNFAMFVPVLLFSVWGGRVSDRTDRRAVVVVTHLASLVVGLALAFAIGSGIANEVHVIVTAFALQTAWSFAKPSLQAMLPDLVSRDELGEAVALNTLQFFAGQIVGPLVATLILVTLGPAWAFGINALTFLAPIASMAYLARRGLARGAVGRGQTDGPGVRSFLREQGWVGAALLVVICTSAIFEVLRTLAPVLTAQRLGQPTSDAGIVVSAQSAGCAIGVIAFALMRRRDLARPVASAGLVLQALGLVGLSLAVSMPVAVAAAAVTGIGFSFCLPVVTAAIQGEVPDALRGRLMSLHQMALLGNRPFTAIAVGAIATAFGAPLGLLAATLFVPVGLVAIRSAWRLLDARRLPAATTAAAAEA